MRSSLAAKLCYGLLTLLCACGADPVTERVAAEPAPGATTGVTPAAPPEAAAETTPAEPEPTARAPFPARGHYQIDLADDGRVSIRANQVGVLEILAGLGEQAGFRVLAGELSWRRARVDLQAETLHDAVGELLRAYPYGIVYGPDAESGQEVLLRVEVGEPPFRELPTGGVAQAPVDPLPPSREQQAYLQQLRDPSPERRAEAAKKAEARGEALEVLTDLIRNDPSPEVRIATTWSLEKSDDPAALEALIGCLGDANDRVVIECLDSLEFAGDESTVEHLEPLLEHRSARVRLKAVESIEFLE